MSSRVETNYTGHTLADMWSYQLLMIMQSSKNCFIYQSHDHMRCGLTLMDVAVLFGKKADELSVWRSADSVPLEYEVNALIICGWYLQQK